MKQKLRKKPTAISSKIIEQKIQTQGSYERNASIHENISNRNLKMLTDLQYSIFERGLLRFAEDQTPKKDSRPMTRQRTADSKKADSPLTDDDQTAEMISIVKEIFRIAYKFPGMLQDLLNEDSEFNVLDNNSYPAILQAFKMRRSETSPGPPARPGKPTGAAVEGPLTSVAASFLSLFVGFIFSLVRRIMKM